MVKARQVRVGLFVTIAALVALGAWGYSTTRGSGIPIYHPPYRGFADCMRYSSKTGRTPLRLVVKNITKHPLRFRGHVIAAIRENLPTTQDGRHHWRRIAYLGVQTPLVTIAPGAIYRWSRVSRPVLLNGSTRHLEAGSCGFYANPPRG
jgi:hypothetical protein